MKSVQTIEEVRSAVARARAAGQAIGFVPTMGALHAGHASLIDAAAKSCPFVVVSIFVNPMQFAPTEDLARYPRTPDKDLYLCERHGAGLVFMPAVETMYGKEGLTEITVKDLSQTLCGRSRPTHFAGVCTVVAKLFNIVLPDRAFFGQKDFQQATIIRRMVADLNFPVEIAVCPTVRESDGLAMSSRNVYLTPQHRRAAPALREALVLGRDLIRRGHPAASTVVSAMREHIARRAPEGEVDYLEIVDPPTLGNVENTCRPVVIAAAVRFGGTRLIDNIAVDVPDLPE